MLNEILVFLGAGGVILLSLFFAYKLGIKTEQNRMKNNEIQTIINAKKQRDQLRSSNVVKQLHTKYKR